MDNLLIVAAFPAGLIVGGFVTMLVDRIPDRTALTLRSRCPECSHDLGWSDVIPVVSWLTRRGRCRHCDARITIAYPAVEVMTACLYVLIVVRFDSDWVAIPPLILVTALIALSAIDLYVYRLPDLITFPAFGLSLVAIAGVSFAVDRTGAIPRALVGAVLYCGILWIAHEIQPRGMGFGDVKLALLLGLHLGWVAGTFYVGWAPVFRLVIYALLLGSLLGLVLGLAVAMLRRRDRDVLPDPEAGTAVATRVAKHSFPFGPALAMGTMIAVLYSDSLLL